MAVPDFQALMLPALRLAGDQQEHTLSAVITALAGEFKLTDDERRELLPSGRQARFDNRVGWAVTYLRKTNLLEKTGRGRFRITALGLKVLESQPARVDLNFLSSFEGFQEFRKRRDAAEVTQEDEAPNGADAGADAQTPEEAIEAAYQSLRQSLAAELLQTVKDCSAGFFERLVVDVLVKMGYGGTRKDAGKAIGRSGDEGIDGIINEDRLGLDVIYLQAKKWENPVGRPEIQKFAGALQGQRAKKGIFITTSTFTREAQEFASRIDSKITLIDGQALSQLMIDYNVGVNLLAAYELKRIDSDYFVEE